MEELEKAPKAEHWTELHKRLEARMEKAQEARFKEVFKAQKAEHMTELHKRLEAEHMTELHKIQDDEQTEEFEKIPKARIEEVLKAQKAEHMTELHKIQDVLQRYKAVHRPELHRRFEDEQTEELKIPKSRFEEVFKAQKAEHMTELHKVQDVLQRYKAVHRPELHRRFEDEQTEELKKIPKSQHEKLIRAQRAEHIQKLHKSLEAQPEELEKARKVQSTEKEENMLIPAHSKYMSLDEATKLCLKHKKCIIHVCKEHKEAICDECLGAHHNNCSTIDISRAISSNEKLQITIKSKLEIKLQQLQNVYRHLNQELSMRDKVIHSSVIKLENTYDTFKQYYIDTLKRNEENLISSLKELEDRRRNFEKILEKVNAIPSEAITVENVLSMYHLEKIAEENIENLNKMCQKESLGKVNTYFDVVANDFNTRLMDFALDPIRDIIYLNIDIVLIKSDSIKPYSQPNFIRGCTICSNDDMSFVDAGNDRLVIVKSNGVRSSFPLPGRPFDVKNGDQRLIVTLRQNRSICFVDTNPIANFSISAKEVKFSVIDTGSIGGISRSGDQVVIAVECFGFYIRDLNGKKMNEIQIKNNINIQYVASDSSKIFYTKSDENRVYCCDYKGNTLWMFEDEKRMKTPTGITVDEDGCVYVSCLISNNVVIISSDGQFCKVLLSLNDDIKRIHAIDYNVFGKKLLICSENGDVRVFKLQKSTFG